VFGGARVGELGRLRLRIHQHGEARVGAADVADQDREFQQCRLVGAAQHGGRASGPFASRHPTAPASRGRAATGSRTRPKSVEVSYRCEAAQGPAGALRLTRSTQLVGRGVGMGIAFAGIGANALARTAGTAGRPASPAPVTVTAAIDSGA